MRTTDLRGPGPGATGAGPAVFALIALFAGLLTAYAMLGRYNLDLHGDMVENFAWGIGWQFGYYKHPPLFAWITAAWFSVLPRTNLSYFLLSSANVGLGLWAMWRISTRFFTADQQILTVATAFFLAPLSILAVNYNATSGMIPVWGLTFLFYLRAIERRRIADAALLGVFAGLSMLVKYHSVVLIAALLVHALLDREMRGLLRTRLPWAAVVAGFVVVAPHLLWMLHNDFITVTYAAEQGPGDWWDTVVYTLRFVPAVVGYAAPAALFLLALGWLRGRRPLASLALVRDWWTRVEGRALIAACAVPPLATIALGVALDARLSSLWSIPFFVFLPLAMVGIFAAALPTRRRLALPAVLAALTAAAIVIAPMERSVLLTKGRGHAATPLVEIAHAADRIWRETNHDTPLRIIAADWNIFANATAFYAPDRPFAIQDQNLALTPWVTVDDIARSGAAYLCQQGAAADCHVAATKLLGKVDETRPFSAGKPAGATVEAPTDFVLLIRRPDA